MAPVVLFLLFLSLTAIRPGATHYEPKETLDVSEVIARANEGITTRLKHGDIRQSLNAAPCAARGCKWPKYRRYVYIPVSISSSYTKWQRNIIIRALLSFHRSTCIRFIWRRWHHRNYLYFFSGTGCWSYLGRQSRGQVVSLRAGRCLYKDTIQHEVLHALGFHHEHVRSDRDEYVRILYGNILPGRQNNFRKVLTNNLNTPYDFDSVMHYSKYAFSKNGLPTILAKSNPKRHFGRSRQMSANDIVRVNRLYQCHE